MTTKEERDRRNFVHTVEVLFASAIAECDLAAASIAQAAAIDRSSWRKRRYVLVAASAAILILVPAVVWLSGRIGPPKRGQAPEQLEMAAKPGAEIVMFRNVTGQVRPEEKRAESAVPYMAGPDDARRPHAIEHAARASSQASLESSDATERMAEARRVEEILAQAARRVSSGDIVGARDLLSAAEDAQGPVTFALAETYDPNMLSAWGASSVPSDVVKARQLYRKALELGITRARMRLDALE